VQHNYVHDIPGKRGGSGYGIHAECAAGAIIRNNVISRTQRHGIYIGRTAVNASAPTVVAGNVIIDHGHGPELYSVKAAAITLARSDNVTAIDNRVVGGHTYGITAEYDPTDGRYCSKCAIFGNKFLNVPGSNYDIWINNKDSSYPVSTWFNTRSQAAAPQPAIQQVDSGLAADFGASGSFWQGTQGIAYGFNDVSQTEYVLIMQNNALHRVIPNWGLSQQSDWRTYNYSTTNWFSFFWLTSHNGVAHVWQNSVLHAVSPQNSNTQWPYTYTNDWFAPAAMDTSTDGKLCVVQNGILHQVTPANWSYTYSNENWSNVSAVAAGRDRCYVRAGSSLYEVTPGTINTPWHKVLLN
jgi:hypothetical protein